MPYCLNCDFDLRESIGKCPECGRAFNLSQPSTYATQPTRGFRNRKLKSYTEWVCIILIFPAAYFTPHVTPYVMPYVTPYVMPYNMGPEYGALGGLVMAGVTGLVMKYWRV